jgi:hypothetical protein
MSSGCNATKGREEGKAGTNLRSVYRRRTERAGRRTKISRQSRLDRHLFLLDLLPSPWYIVSEPQVDITTCTRYLRATPQTSPQSEAPYLLNFRTFVRAVFSRKRSGRRERRSSIGPSEQLCSSPKRIRRSQRRRRVRSEPSSRDGA